MRSFGFLIVLFGCGGASTPPDAPPANPPAPTTAATTAATTTATALPTPSTPAAPEGPPVPVATASAAPSAAPSASATGAPVDPPSGTPGANLNVASMDVNGLKVANLSCRLDDVGLMTAAILIGSLAKQKAAFKACGNDQPKIEWTAAGGKVKDVKVTAKNATVEKCVARAMTGAPMAVEGRCSATLVLDR